MFSITFPTTSQLACAADVAHVFLLCFPLIFVLGLLPQINTFAMYLLEQVDIHAFGGNAMSSLTSAVYCVVRSLLAVGTLIGFAYGGLTGEAHTQHTQEILFSIFCCLTMAVGYHLSRSSSDPTVIFSLIRRQLLVTTVNAELDASEESSSNKDTVRQQEGSSSPTSCSAASATATAVEEGKSPAAEAGENNIGASTTSSSSSSSSTTVNSVYDPLPKKLRSTVNARLKNDAIICVLIAVAAFLLHVSGVFTKLQPNLNYVLWIAASVSGFLCHYILPQLRKQLPWLCFSHPLLKSHEYDHFEVRQAARVMWFERIYVVATFLEKNIIYPMVFLSALSTDLEAFKMMPPLWGALVMTVTALKCFRAAYSDCSRQYFILLLTVLVFRFDPESRNVLGMTTGSLPGQHSSSDPFMLHYFVISIIFHKLFEFYLKVQFVITYIAPWQITWGSAFHAFAQPFSVPHSAMLFLQAGLSALFSTPLNPILGSAIFCTSYVRPVKFWERDYNTKRSDHSNTRLSSHLDRNPAAAGGVGADDNNLNSIFYEHLTRSLQVRKTFVIVIGHF